MAEESKDFILALFAKKARESEWTQGQMDRINESNIRTARLDFMDLYSQICKVADSIDSAKLNRVIDHFAYVAEETQKALDEREQRA